MNGDAQQLRTREHLRQCGDARRLVVRRVVGDDARAREQLADDRLVDVAVLAQVELRQVEAEHIDRAAQRVEAARRERCRAVRRERRGDRVEIGAQVRRRGVRFAHHARRSRRYVARERSGGSGEAAVDPDQRLPIRLVLPVRILVVRVPRELEQRGRRLHQSRRQRQLAAEPVHLIEVMLERDGRLRADRVRQRFRRHERIAVAVAADPRAGTQERLQPGHVEVEIVRKPRRHVRVELRNLVEKRVAVVREAVVDLVLHLELREPDHRGLPQLEHLAVERGVELGDLGGRQLDAVAPDEQPRDLALGVEDALALDLGRMRGQHRRDQRLVEPARDRRTVDAGRGEALERVRDAAALRRRAGERVRAAAAVLVHVLGDVGEMREVAERAHDMEHLGDRQRIQHRRQLVAHGVRAGVVGAPEADRRLPDRLDPREARLSRLRAQHVAEHAAEQARVFLEREILVDRAVHRASSRPVPRNRAFPAGGC